MEKLVELKNIYFALKDQVILKDVSLSLMQGKIMTLIGPNGAGKSTLLRLILGLLKPQKGTLWKAPHLKVGYVPQNLILGPTLPITVAGFLNLSPLKEASSLKAELIEKMGISCLLKRFMGGLSGGERQRVLLVRALLRRPNLLILDEPAQGVDILGQSDLYKLISHMRDREGCGVLLVSHDLHLVLESSDEVICLNQHVCCSGHPGTIIHTQEYKALFGHLAPYTHSHDHRHDLGIKNA